MTTRRVPNALSPQTLAGAPMSSVGVTGATGFIAGALVPRLGLAGHDLRLVDDRSGPVRVEHREWPVPNLAFSSEDALKLFADCDLVLHLGAVSGVMPCANDPIGTARVNIDGTRRLYTMCRERKISVAFASSFAVVGAPERLPVREDTPARPTHEYARQKSEGERLTNELAGAGGVRSAILRQSNVYGGYITDGRRVSKPNVLELFARQAREGRLLVNAPGTQRRDFVHIDDVVAHWEATARFLLRPNMPPSTTTFNVASGESLSILDLASRVAQAYPRAVPGASPPKIEVVPNPRAGVELVEPGFSVDRSRTDRELGVRCQRRLEDELPLILRPSGSGSARDR